MKTHEILQPLFDIVNKIHCETSLALDFGIRTFIINESDEDERWFKRIYWFIGEAGNELHGKFLNTLDVDDLDENKLDCWVTELSRIYDNEMGYPECSNCGGSLNPESASEYSCICEIQNSCQNEESLVDISRYENHRIDSQEDRKI